MPGALMYVYANETLNLVPVFSDSGLTVPTPNPAEANASGQFPPVWVDGGTEEVPIFYTVAVTQADGSSPGNPFIFDDFSPSVGSGGGADKLDRSGDNADDVILNNLPFVAPAANSLSRATSAKLAETLSANDFANATAGIKFNYAAAAAGERGKAVSVPSGSYTRNTSALGNFTWLLDGPTTITGTEAANFLPGQIIQFSGVKNPDGSTPAANPMYVGLPTRAFVTGYTSLTGRVSPLDVATFAAFSPYGYVGLFGGTRSSDNTNAGYDEGGIAGFFFCDNDRTSPKKGMYGVYIDAVRRAGAGVTHAVELDTVNMGSLVPVTPTSSFDIDSNGIPDDFTTGLWVASGGAVAGAQPASVAMTILANGATWNSGIVIREGSLVQRGTGLVPELQAMAVPFGSQIVQYAEGLNSGVVGKISFEGITAPLGTLLLFDEAGASFVDLTTRANRFNVNAGGFTFGPAAGPWMNATTSAIALNLTTTIGGPSGNFSLQVTNIPTAGNFVEVQAGTPSNGPLIRAQGSDSVAWLRLQGKSTAGVQLLLSQVGDYADDAAAATGGVPVGGLYRTASAMKVRTV